MLYSPLLFLTDNINSESVISGRLPVYVGEAVVLISKCGGYIAHDNTSMYFDMFMDGLQPERYYRILVKTEVDGSTLVIDSNEVFKVVRNG